MSVNLGFKRTFQYSQALYSVVRFSLKLFLHCNDEMAVVEGIPVSEMLNRSFYEVFENGDKKWLVTCACVLIPS